MVLLFRPDNYRKHVLPGCSVRFSCLSAGFSNHSGDSKDSGVTAKDRSGSKCTARTRCAGQVNPHRFIGRENQEILQDSPKTACFAGGFLLLIGSISLAGQSTATPAKF